MRQAQQDAEYMQAQREKEFDFQIEKHLPFFASTDVRMEIAQHIADFCEDPADMVSSIMDGALDRAAYNLETDRQRGIAKDLVMDGDTEDPFREYEDAHVRAEAYSPDNWVPDSQDMDHLEFDDIMGRVVGSRSKMKSQERDLAKKIASVTPVNTGEYTENKSSSKSLGSLTAVPDPFDTNPTLPSGGFDENAKRMSVLTPMETPDVEEMKRDIQNAFAGATDADSDADPQRGLSTGDDTGFGGSDNNEPDEV